MAHHTNTTSLEVGLCEELIAQKVHDTHKDTITTGIENLHEASRQIAARLRDRFQLPAIDQVLVGCSARIKRRTVHTGDAALVIVHGNVIVGSVNQFFQTATLPAQVDLTPWRLVDSDGTSARYRTQSASQLLPLNNLLESVAHSKTVNIKHVLLPLHWQDLHGSTGKKRSASVAFD